ncbi:MAG: carboxypeptidase-like regulatory domain-containing protein [Candidatus Bathyarchaeia archaeon]|jgi:hypothetical protein
MVGTFTYDATNNIITVTGGTSGSPVGFIDFWNADKAGTRTLLATTPGSAGMSLTTPVKPTDKLALKLTFVVSAFSVAGVITINGFDAWGNANTENITVNANGSYATTLYYASVNAAGINCTGTYSISVTQPQWGIIWKQSTNSFLFNCGIVIGNNSTATYFTDYGKQITFSATAISANGQSWLVTLDNATTTFGQCADVAKKTTHNGINFAVLDAAHYGYFGIGDPGSALQYYYSCEFWSAGGTIFIRATRIWNCLLDSNTDLNLVNSGGDIDTLVATNALRGIRTWPGITVNRVFLIGCTYGIWPYAATGTISNIYSRYCTNTLYLSYFNGTAYLVNWDSDSYACAGDHSTGTVYRQYTFDLLVADKAGNPIPGATVTVKDTNGTLVFSVTTKADGTIDTQTITRTTYGGSNGGTVTDYAPHALTIIKAGYQTYAKTFVLSAKTSWEIKLAKAQALLLDSGGPVVNLSPRDPENNMVLAL